LRKSQDGYVLKVDPAVVESYDEQQELKETHFSSLLTAISSRSVVIRGIGSAVLSNASAKTMAAKLGNAPFVEIPRAGHSVVTDNPEAVNGVLVELLRGSD
jgi:pimeloyl-ACP methyl ester carboxylesterase